MSTRLTIIHKSDIDSMMSSTPYVKRNRISHTPITDFYTTAEVASKYGVNESWIFKVGKEQNIPKVFKRGKHTGVPSILINILHLKHRTPTLRNGIL